LVEKGDKDPQEDMMALDFLSSAVPPEMVSVVVSRDTVKEAWEVIKVLQVDDDCRRASTVYQLLQQIENATFKEDESIEDFSMCLSGMVQHLATLGETVEDSKVVGKFLRSVPYCYQQIVVEIQTLLDVNKLTLANVIGRLKAVEEEPEVLPLMVNHTNKLCLSEEAWEERWKQRDTKKPSSDGLGGRGGRQHRGCLNRGHGNSGSRGSNGSLLSGSARLGKDQCKHYIKFGHWVVNVKTDPKVRRRM
jgi:hypothetical protein